MMIISRPGTMASELRLRPTMQYCISAACWLFTVLLIGGAAGCNRLPTSASANAVSAKPMALPDDEELKRRLDHALDLVYAERRLNVREHAVWQIVHGAVA